jgi:hypothetical protein
VTVVPEFDDPHHFTIGLLAVLLMMMASVLVYVVRTYTQARAANRAVNDTEPGDHRLYDRVAAIGERLDRIDIELDRNNADHEHIITLIHRKHMEVPE